MNGQEVRFILLAKTAAFSLQIKKEREREIINRICQCSERGMKASEKKKIKY